SSFLQYDRQGGTRGEDQVALLDWAMLVASRSLAGGQLDLRGMLSTDPWGVGSAGYPLLLQTGESNRGVPLHDHQHPHDLFMEVAALYRRADLQGHGAAVGPGGAVRLPQESGGAAPGRSTAPVRGRRAHDAAVREGRTVGERADVGRERPVRLEKAVE